METIAACVVTIPGILFGMYCAVSVVVSRMEDRAVNSEDLVAMPQAAETLTDLRKAA